MRIISEPEIYVIGRQTLNQEEVARFLEDHATSWQTDSDNGSELIVELAGRICYLSFGNKQFRKTNADYVGNLINRGHGSVLEHAVWDLLITGVSRSLTHELVRHRAGTGFCLAGDTLIYSDHMRGTQRSGITKRTIAKLFEMTKTPHGRSRLRLLHLRCLDEGTGLFTTSRPRRVVCNGLKPVFKVELHDGKTVTCTKEHRFLTREGWMPLTEVVGGLAVTANGLAVYGRDDAEIMVNGVPAYKDAAWLRDQYVVKNSDQVTIAKLAGVSSHTIRSWVRKHGLQKPLGSWTEGVTPWNKGTRYSPGWRHTFKPTGIRAITYVGEQMTYDIEMEGPNHNFVANGIVTHNSQLSQRYVDESTADFVEPAVIAGDPELHEVWKSSIEAAHEAYKSLVEKLAVRVESTFPDLPRTQRHKMAREAARSVLPNATETKVLLSANARALRWIMTLRGGEGAEPEIRRLAVKLARLMQNEAPNLFHDIEIVQLPDGTEGVTMTHQKV